MYLIVLEWDRTGIQRRLLFLQEGLAGEVRETGERRKKEILERRRMVIRGEERSPSTFSGNVMPGRRLCSLTRAKS